MKLIARKEGFADVNMGCPVVGKTVDSESVKLTVPFFIGEREFIIKGTLNVARNLFYQDRENEVAVEKYFDGYGIDLVSAVENR